VPGTFMLDRLKAFCLAASAPAASVQSGYSSAASAVHSETIILRLSESAAGARSAPASRT
jgi:hypothetical protein